MDFVSVAGWRPFALLIVRPEVKKHFIVSQMSLEVPTSYSFLLTQTEINFVLYVSQIALQLTV